MTHSRRKKGLVCLRQLQGAPGLPSCVPWLVSGWALRKRRRQLEFAGDTWPGAFT